MKFSLKLKDKLSWHNRLPLSFLTKRCLRRGSKREHVCAPPRLSEAFFHLLKRVIDDDREYNELCQRFQEIFVDRLQLKYKHGNDTFGYRQVIGKGNFGIVYRAHYFENGKNFDLCVKVLH